MTQLLLLVAEIDAPDEATAMRRLDAFREAAVPSDHGVTLYRATLREVWQLLHRHGGTDRVLTETDWVPAQRGSPD